VFIMAKKKGAVPPRKSTASKKTTAAKPTGGKKPTSKPSRAAKKAVPQKSAAKQTAKKAVKKKTAKHKAPALPSLGRPLVTAEEKLYLLFKEDYEARQVFEFLRVESVGDLERYSPEEIVKILSAPVRTTVQRIRRRLAEKKRALQGDQAFALEHPPTETPGT
jgi:hypothetical protein